MIRAEGLIDVFNTILGCNISYFTTIAHLDFKNEETIHSTEIIHTMYRNITQLKIFSPMSLTQHEIFVHQRNLWL
jgi:hypothetical protein